MLYLFAHQFYHSLPLKYPINRGLHNRVIIIHSSSFIALNRPIIRLPFIEVFTFNHIRSGVNEKMLYN